MPLSTAAPAKARRTPGWAVHAQGAHLWDAQGRRHLDMSCGGGAVLLGHAEPRVEAAAASPPSHAEARAADALLAHAPSSGAVRFCRDAEEAMAAAVTLAVRATDRTELVRVTGPPAAADVQARVCAGDVAALVLEADAATPPLLHAARAITAAHGVLLILDETVAGLRRGRACGIRADLTVFGAGVANGRPLGALAGDAALLSHMPEAAPATEAALAAAAATLAIVGREPVASHLSVRGGEIEAELEGLLAGAGADAVARVVGDPTWITLEIRHPDARGLQRRLAAQLAARGVHAPGPLAVSYRHEDAEVEALLDAMSACLPWLADATRADAA